MPKHLFEKGNTANLKHGQWKTGIYRTWCMMHQRCRNPKNNRFEAYGGRGIQVCKMWLSFQKFFDDMGPRPDGYDLHRLDNDGDYEPSNCIWIPHGDHMQFHGGLRTTPRSNKTGRYLAKRSP